MKRFINSAILASAMAVSSFAHAAFINVGGVVWDPDAVTAFPSLIDFTGNGTILEVSTTGIPGDTVTGRGQITRMNSAVDNQASFCPGCELTFTFSMDLVSITPIPVVSPTFASFIFTNLAVSVFVDNTPNFDGSFASAADGVLWLSLVGNGNLTGTGDNIGTGSDTGTGTALLDVVGGLAMGNFDTNTRVNGADMVFSSSFQPLVGTTEGGRPLLQGTLDLTGNSIPEPGTLALLGLGLLGLRLGTRRNK